MANCPSCGKPVRLGGPAAGADSKRVRRDTLGTVKKEVMYSCPHCDVVLGFSFFIGGLLTGRPK